MYDENELYNEMFNTVKTTGQTAMSLIEQLNKLNEYAKTPDSTNTDFIFTGQSTDLRYFANSDVMPISMIEQIPDATLKNAVKDEFNKAILSKKVELDINNDTIKITKSSHKLCSFHLQEQYRT
ncbi:MAG: hypothetical protein K2K91_08330 [Ruminococcus sp.]|nr:hypothetical protein [Ruminococcus sp.]